MTIRPQQDRTIHRVPIYGGTMHCCISSCASWNARASGRRRLILADERIAGGGTVRHLLEVADGLRHSAGAPAAFERIQARRQRARPELRPIAVEDLLGRSQNVLDREAMQQLVAGTQGAGYRRGRHYRRRA